MQEGGGLDKEAMASPSSSLWEKATPPALTLQLDNSLPPHMSLVPFAFNLLP